MGEEKANFNSLVEISRIGHFGSMSTCKHDSTAPDPVLKALHVSQAGMKDGIEIWRHKCCNCAFVNGEGYAKANAIAPAGTALCKKTGLSAPFEAMNTLPLSQAGSGRHQCAICAFHEGFNRGRALVVAKDKPVH